MTRPRLTRAEWFTLVVVLFVALALRLFQLDRSELWFDEAFAALVAMEPAGVLVGELARDTSPPLYFLLLRGWLLLFAADPSTLRSLSVVLGLLGVLAIFVAGQRLWGTYTGLASAALLAVSPLHVYYSREVRPYALLILLALMSLVALDAMTRDRRRRVLTAYCVVTSAAVWTHHYGWLLLVPLGIWVLARRLDATRALEAVAIVVVAYLPWLSTLAGQVSSGASQWVERLWADTPPAMAPFLSLAAFSVGGSTPAYVPTGSDTLPAFEHGAAYVLFALLVLTALVRDQAGTARRLALTVVAMLAIPIAVSFVQPIFLVGRHDVLVLPFFLLLAGCGATLLSARQAAVAAVVAVALAAAASSAYQTLPATTMSLARAAVLLEHARPGDGVLATGFTRNGVEYLLRERGSALSIFSFPTSFGTHRGWVDERELADATFIRADADQLVRTLGVTIGDGRLLWVLHTRELAAANEVLFARLDRAFRQVRCPGDAEAHGITCWRRQP